MSKAKFTALYMVLAAILFIFAANGLPLSEMKGEQAVFAGFAIACLVFSFITWIEGLND